MRFIVWFFDPATASYCQYYLSRYVSEVSWEQAVEILDNLVVTQERLGDEELVASYKEWKAGKRNRVRSDKSEFFITSAPLNWK